MPASYVHQCIALEACRALPPYAASPDGDALRAGAEGPDPLFFSLSPLGGAFSMPRMAAMLHNRHTDIFLLALLDACRGAPLLQAFACGFLAHYAADTICHPFIYARSLTADGAYSSTAHSRLEQSLDMLYYRRQGHARGLPRQLAGYAALSGGDKDAIAAAFAAAVQSAYPGYAPGAARIRRSFDDAVMICRLLQSGDGRLFRAAGRLSGVGRLLQAHMLPPCPPQTDAANERHAPWASLWAPEIRRTESFFDLCDAAVSRAGSLILSAQGYFSGTVSYASMRARLGGLSYASGLPWSGTCPAAKAPGTKRPAAQRSA